jgi:hypothetical protein
MHKRPAERVQSASEVVERLRPWTDSADASAWQQIGRFAAAPGDHSISGAMLADTIAVDSSEIDTGEQTPARRGDATASLPGAPFRPDIQLGSRASRSRRVAERLRPAKIVGLTRLLVGVVVLAAAVLAVLALLNR